MFMSVQLGTQYGSLYRENRSVRAWQSCIWSLWTVVLVILSVSSPQASVREDQRACQFGYWKTLKQGSAPPRTNNADEQYCTGLAYWFQPSPLRRAPASAAPWYEAAAKQGHVGAMVALGYQYEKGYGVDADAGKAFELYQRAAERGSPDAMFNVFRLYTTGKGVKADAGQARKVARKSGGSRQYRCEEGIDGSQPWRRFPSWTRFGECGLRGL